MNLSNSVAVVTGGVSGLGLAAVKQFLQAGAKVALFDLNEKAGKELELKNPGKVLFQKVNVADAASARDLGRFGIRVMTIALGIFDTPMMQGVSEEYRQPLVDMVQCPQRLGLPAEYGQLCISIVENNYLNGETIRLDGAIRMNAR